MQYITSIDLLGAEFNFTIFGKKSYDTIYGGVLSLLVAIATVSVCFFFGLDLVRRTNPKVLQERVLPINYSYVNASIQNFPIFWTLIDDNGSPVNFTDILFPKLNFYVSKLNATQGNWDLLDHKLLTIKPCTRDLVQNDEINDKLGLNIF